MDDHQFKDLLEYLGLSWKGYRKVRNGVKRRLRRHMSALHCRNSSEYITRLSMDKTARERCDQLISVSISRFFRDRRLWEILEAEILPQILRKATGGVKVWFAGCACGEEVYSLKILWDRLRERIPGVPVIEITATDINPICINRAIETRYPSSSLKELPASWKERYFEEQEEVKVYLVKDFLKRNITWRVTDFISNIPHSEFDLIFLRNNLLTYYVEDLRLEVLEKISDTLLQGGFLIIGSHEKIPSGSLNLRPINYLPFVYKKYPSLRDGTDV